MSIRHFET